MPSQGGHQKPILPLWVRDRMNDHEARKYLGLGVRPKSTDKNLSLKREQVS